MSAFIQQFLSLLIESPGSLIYHLVLAFSVAGALIATMSAGRFAGRDSIRRTAIGLLLLLAMRVALFAIAGFAWQSLLDERVILPPLDRAISLLGLVLIAWMWVVPVRVRLADTATVILFLLVLTGTMLTYVWWGSQGAGLGFNGSWPDMGMQILAALIAMGSLLAMGIRRPDGWGFGFVLMIILLGGHIYQLFLPPAEGDYSGVLRLTQLIAYPLLLALPQRLGGSNIPDEHTHDVRSGLSVDPDLVGDYLSISRAASLETTRRAATRALARSFDAGMGILLGADEDSDKFPILCVWSGRFIDTVDLSLDSQSIPVILSSWNRGRGLILPADSSSPDLTGLTSTLGWQRAPHIMAAPVPRQDAIGSLGGIILTTNPSGPGWSSEELTRLSELLAAVAHLLHPSKTDLSLEDRQDLAAQFGRLEEELAKLRLEKSLLEERLEESGISLSGPLTAADSAPGAMAELLAAHEEAQDLIKILQVENERLENLINVDREPRHEIRQADAPADGELRLALEEVARLRSMLSDADHEVNELRRQVDLIYGSHESGDLITSVAQELRQPMSSIVGYTDILLGETVGILGSLQRKYLERVKASSQRMNRLVNDLIQITGLEGELPSFSSQWVDLAEVFDTVLTKAADRIQNEDVSLRIDFPAQLPYLMTDPVAMTQALLDLVENACEITPPEGEIGLSARLEKDNEGYSSYVLIRVSDQGGGIASEDIPRVFAPRVLEDDNAIAGIGSRGVALPVVKALVEALGGRIWVDSEIGVGSTFSLLMPVTLQDSGASHPPRDLAEEA